MRREKPEKIRYIPRKTAEIPSDVLGSFVGMPMTNEELSDGDPNPVQDADDL